MSTRETRSAKKVAPSRQKKAPPAAGNRNMRFHAVRSCRSIKGSAVFTNWQDCQSVLTKAKNSQCASFDDWDEAYRYIQPGASNNAATTGDGREATTSKAAATLTNMSTTGSTSKRAATASSRATTSSSTTNRKRTIDQVSVPSTPDTTTKSVAAATSPTTATADHTSADTAFAAAPQTEGAVAAAPPETPIDPDTTELPVVIKGSGPPPKQEISEWHLGRKQWRFEKNFKEKTDQMESYFARFGQTRQSPEYNTFEGWIRNIRPQVRVYQALQEKGNAHGVLEGQRFILYLKKAHFERLQALGVPSLTEPVDRAVVKQEAEPVVWQERHEELKQFKEKWGHVVVRRREKLDKVGKLVSWVDLQRKEYRRLQQGQESTMTDERIAKLTELGLELNVKAPMSHDDRAREWLVYKATHNGQEPPKSFNNGLHQWIYRTREKYERLQKGDKTSLTQEQADQLDSWGFRWVDPNKKNQARKQTWEERYQEYVDHRERHGTAWITKNSCSLGQWCADQRKNSKVMKETGKGPMTAERIAKLEAAGFPWEKGENAVYDIRAAKRHRAATNAETDSSGEEEEEDNVEEETDEQQHDGQYGRYAGLTYRTPRDAALGGYRAPQQAVQQQHGGAQHGDGPVPWERYKTSNRFR